MVIIEPPVEPVPVAVEPLPVAVLPPVEQRIVTIPDTGPESRARGSVVNLDPSKRTK